MLVIGFVQALFWMCVLFLLHTFVLYPLSLRLASFRHGSSDSRMNWRPTVTLAIAAYNERDIIERKLENSLALEYPDERLRIVVVDDGSTDGTDELVRSFANRGVDLLRVEGRVGKTACQNELVAAVETEIVVFSDADSMYEPEAIARLVDSFEPGIGCVVGDLRYLEDGRIDGEHLYWRFEQFLKGLESQVSTIVTGTGAIYAVRRSSYESIPADAISDFELPLAILERGERVVYAPDAVAWEQMSGSVGAELQRRHRIATRAWRTGLRRRMLFNPLRRPLVAYQLFSHRGLLALTPLFAVGLFGSSLILVASDTGPGLFEHVSLAITAVFVFLAGLSAVVRATGRRPPTVFDVPYYLALSGVGTLRGLSNLRDDDRYTTWETLDRSAGESNAEPVESSADD